MGTITNSIQWKLLLNKPPEKVYDFINSNDGRSKFWAESAIEVDKHIHFKFINGWEYKAEILNRTPHTKFVIDYFDSRVSFTLVPKGDITELHLENSGVTDEEFQEINAGWVSVLMALKAAIEHNIDLRNHDRAHCWDQKFVDN